MRISITIVLVYFFCVSCYFLSSAYVIVNVIGNQPKIVSAKIVLMFKTQFEFIRRTKLNMCTMLLCDVRKVAQLGCIVDEPRDVCCH